MRRSGALNNLVTEVEIMVHERKCDVSADYVGSWAGFPVMRVNFMSFLLTEEFGMVH